MLNRVASAAGVAHSVVTGFGTRQVPPPTPGTAQAAADQAAYDVEAHVEMLDRLALDAEIVTSLTVLQGTSWAPPHVANDVNRAINDEIAAWVAAHPTRLIGSFTLPLQSRELTLEELHRCVTDLNMTWCSFRRPSAATTSARWSTATCGRRSPSSG
jgi:predicted TIM-barrel fold metal-dependent hydrolase